MTLPLTYAQAAGLLLDWYAACGRTLPWRSSKDPYAVWVSEIMLQQTQVKTVIPYFERFMKRFPTVVHLSQASLEEVYQIWEGLGYYRRASQLHEAARILCRDHAGIFPEDPALIRQLPGIGDYTAGAIASIAFGVPVAAVDGNVIRVITRFGGFSCNIADAASRKEINAEAAGLHKAAAGHPGDLTQALMDLGAMICTPKNPQCLHCPWKTDCRAHELDCPEAFPVKPAKKEKVLGDVACGLLIRDGRILLCRRPGSGIWANLWTLPLSKAHDRKEAALEDLKQWLAPLGAIPAKAPIEQVRHTFTHKIWQIRVYRCEMDGRQPAETKGDMTGEPVPGPIHDSLWIPLQQLSHYPMPVPMRNLKVLNL